MCYMTISGVNQDSLFFHDEILDSLFKIISLKKQYPNSGNYAKTTENRICVCLILLKLLDDQNFHQFFFNYYVNHDLIRLFKNVLCSLTSDPETNFVFSLIYTMIKYQEKFQYTNEPIFQSIIPDLVLLISSQPVSQQWSLKCIHHLITNHQSNYTETFISNNIISTLSKNVNLVSLYRFLKCINSISQEFIYDEFQTSDFYSFLIKNVSSSGYKGIREGLKFILHLFRYKEINTDTFFQIFNNYEKFNFKSKYECVLFFLSVLDESNFVLNNDQLIFFIEKIIEIMTEAPDNVIIKSLDIISKYFSERTEIIAEVASSTFINDSLIELMQNHNEDIANKSLFIFHNYFNEDNS